jgi:hypothetical protein
VHLLQHPGDNAYGQQVRSASAGQRRERCPWREKEKADDQEDRQHGRDLYPHQVLTDNDALLVDRRGHAGDTNQVICGRGRKPAGVELAGERLRGWRQAGLEVQVRDDGRRPFT